MTVQVGGSPAARTAVDKATRTWGQHGCRAGAVIVYGHRDHVTPSPRARGCSDPGAAEHLAGVVAGQAGLLECVRARAGGAVANQPGLVIARVDGDRPLAVVVVADDPSGSVRIA